MGATFRRRFRLVFTWLLRGTLLRGVKTRIGKSSYVAATQFLAVSVCEIAIQPYSKLLHIKVTQPGSTTT